MNFKLPLAGMFLISLSMIQPLSAEETESQAPVGRIQRSMDLLQRSEEQNKWLLQSRIYRFSQVRTLIDGQVSSNSPDVSRITGPFQENFLKQAELDDLFAQLRQSVNSAYPTLKKLSISLEQEILIIDIRL